MKQSVLNNYTIGEVIGRGSYASVHKAINKQTGETCAIKKIKMTFNLTRLAHEIAIIKASSCENIVKFLDAELNTIGHVYIIMEYCCGGSVKDVIRDLDRTMNSEHISVILKDILNGLNYLHIVLSKIHRDIKAANILLDEKGIAKLADFGVTEPKPADADPSRSASFSSNRKGSIIGTPLWLPPEVLNQNPDYGLSIDIWSLGITVIEMGDGQPPFSDWNQEAALNEIKNLDKPGPTFRDPSKWPASLINFISLCLDKDPTKRKSADDLLNHEIIKNAPPHSIIKDLVDEVCSSRVNRLQSEAELHRKAESLIKECANNFARFKENRMKVIMVDQMANCLVSLEEEFRQILEVMDRKGAHVAQIQARSRALANEIMELERLWNELKTTLDKQRARKSGILDELAKIDREKERHFETLNLQRRLKLRSLEGKSN